MRSEKSSAPRPRECSATMEGADSARFERLKEVYNKVIGAICLRGVTEDDAKACFADVLSNSKRFKEHHLTLVFQRLFMEQVPRNLKLEFQDVCEEFKVAASLERLDQITERRRTRSALACPASSAESADNANPHQHDAMTPERMVTEAICAKKRARLETLRARLASEEQALRDLVCILEASQGEEASMRERLENLVAPFEEHQQQQQKGYEIGQRHQSRVDQPLV